MRSCVKRNWCVPHSSTYARHVNARVPTMSLIGLDSDRDNIRRRCTTPNGLEKTHIQKMKCTSGIRIYLTFSHNMIHHFSIRANNLPSDPSHLDVYSGKACASRIVDGGGFRVRHWIDPRLVHHSVWFPNFFFVSSFLGIRNNSIHQSIDYTANTYGIYV